LSPLATVLVRYFAAARAAARCDEEAIELAPGVTTEQVIDAIGARHGAEMERLLGRCSFLLDAVAVGARPREIRPGSTLDVLPPFAGG